jgi:hypothetical protein
MHRLHILVILALVLCSGCVPLPQHEYVAHADDGQTVYSSCPLNKHVPTGVRFERDYVHIEVSVGRNAGRDYVEVRFDVPDGKTVLLRNGIVKVRRSRSQVAQTSTFPNVSLVDAPIINSYSQVPGAKAEQRSVDTPLVGKTFVETYDTWDKHFWLATYIDTASDDDIWISLPDFTINGMAVDFAPLHFRRETVVILALINC